MRPNTKPKKKGSTLGGIIVIVVFIAIVVGIIMALTGGSKPKTTASNNTAPASTASTTPAASSTAQQVANWVTKYGTVFTTFSNDFSSIGTASGNSDTATLLTDCKKLQTDVTTAQAYPAIPDSTSASDLSTALTYMQSASQNCIDGLNNSDSNQLSQSAKEITQSTTAIGKVNADIKALTP